MRILDRTIARLFLTNVVMVFAFLFLMIIAVDFSLNFDEYTKAAGDALAARGRSAPGVVRVLLGALGALDLWWPRLFVLFNHMLGPVLVAALGFTCAYLVKQRETVAMLASGISLRRAAAPMLVCVAILTAAMIVNHEVVIPRLAPLLMRERGDASATGPKDLAPDAAGRLFYFRTLSADGASATGVCIWERDSRGLMLRRINADAAQWQDGAWILENGRAQARAPLEGAGPGTRLPEQKVERVVTDLDPGALRLRRDERMSSNLSTAQLGTLIRRYQLLEDTPANQRRAASFERLQWGRPASAAATVLTFILCLPFFLRKEPTNMLVQSLYAAPVALGAFAGVLVGTTASVPGLPAQVGVFLPVVMLVPGAIIAAGSIRS